MEIKHEIFPQLRYEQRYAKLEDNVNTPCVCTVLTNTEVQIMIELRNITDEKYFTNLMVVILLSITCVIFVVC